MGKERGIVERNGMHTLDFYYTGNNRYRESTGVPVEYGRRGKAKKPPENVLALRDEAYRDKLAFVRKQRERKNRETDLAGISAVYLQSCSRFNDMALRTYLIGLVVARFGKQQMASVTIAQAASWRDNMVNEGRLSIRSINQRTQYGSAFWNWAIGEGYAEENPFKKTKLKGERGRERVLSPTEEVALIEACPSWFAPMVKTAIYTGLRQGNLIRLKRSQVDLKDGWIRIPRWDTKGGRSQRDRVTGTLEVPLNNSALDALRSVTPSIAHEFWFSSVAGGPLSKNSVTSAFRSTRERSGIDNLTFHDLRHTAATRAAQSGMDAPTMKEVFGWSDISMVQKYVNVSKDHKKKMMERMDGTQNG